MWFAGGGWCRRLCSRPSRSRSLSSIRRPPSSTLFPYRRSSDLATGEARYLEIAEDLVRLLDRDFADSGSAGYFDAAATDPTAPALAERTKPVLDDLLPGGNGWAGRVLLRLARVTGDVHYRRRAEVTLEAFAGAIGGEGLRASSYLAAEIGRAHV